MLEHAILELTHAAETERELLQITWRMLEAIHNGDAHTYADLSLPDLSCYEDVCAYRIDGLEFHLSLIRQMAQSAAIKSTRFDMLTPRVQVHGDSAIVTYTRLMTYDDGGKPHWQTFNETRVFVRKDGLWKMAHFHRTPSS